MICMYSLYKNVKIIYTEIKYIFFITLLEYSIAI